MPYKKSKADYIVKPDKYKHTKPKSRNPWSPNYDDSPKEEDTTLFMPQDYSQGYVNPYVNTPDAPVFDTPSAQKNVANLRSFLDSNKPLHLQNRWKQQPERFTFSQPIEKCSCDPKKEGFEYDINENASLPYSRGGLGFDGDDFVVKSEKKMPALETPVWERKRPIWEKKSAEMSRVSGEYLGTYKKKPEGLGYKWPTKEDYLYFRVKTESERKSAFKYKHPGIALQVGLNLSTKCGTNIFSVAVRFSNALREVVTTKDATEEEINIIINGIRHIFGSLILTSKFGNLQAKEITDLHEMNPNLIEDLTLIYGNNPLNYKVPKLPDMDHGMIIDDKIVEGHSNAYDNADSIVDLLNNTLGRGLGNEIQTINGMGAYKDQFLYVLSYCNKVGAYSYHDKGTYYDIEQYRLSNEMYQKCKEVVASLDQFGWTPEERDRCMRGVGWPKTNKK